MISSTCLIKYARRARRNLYDTATSCVHTGVLIREVSCVIGMAMSGFVCIEKFSHRECLGSRNRNVRSLAILDRHILTVSNKLSLLESLRPGLNVAFYMRRIELPN